MTGWTQLDDGRDSNQLAQADVELLRNVLNSMMLLICQTLWKHSTNKATEGSTAPAVEN